MINLPFISHMHRGGEFMLHNIMLGSDGLSVGICTGRHDIHIPVNE